MQLQVGDRLADETGEWEIIGRPYTTAGGKTAHVRVQRVGQPDVTDLRTWGAHERINIKPGRTEMKRVMGVLVVIGMGLWLGLAEQVVAASCPADSVQSGTVCMDKYEASVWKVPPTQTTLISKIKNSTVKLTDLTSPKAVAAGVVHLGLVLGDLAAAGCPVTGNGCVDFYSVSISGVTPSAFLTWFQAVAVARNSLKRLPTNQEWQVAALGTPDAGADCNTSGTGPDLTGVRTNCVSDVGAFDMVGNVSEWVADWVPRSTHPCGTWGTFSNDYQCLVGAEITGQPGALIRGGDFNHGAGAGVFAVFGDNGPFDGGFGSIGFRTTR